MFAKVFCNLKQLLANFYQVSAHRCLFIEEETNDALFYDPSMDDDDEAWVKRQRASYRPSPNKPSSASVGTAGAKTKDTKSDAVLNCPACMCAVCLDCQRYAHMLETREE